MKVIIKNFRFSGGGSRSMLEYAKVLKNINMNVLVYGKYVETPDEYTKSEITTYDFPQFIITKPIRSILMSLKFKKVLQKEKPNIVIATGPECYTLKLIEDKLKCNIIYMWQGGEIRLPLAKILNKDHIIVFSEENKNQLLNYGYDQNYIHLISNRIKVNETYANQRMIEKFNNNKNLSCALISRIDSDKYNSIIYTIDFLSQFQEYVTLDIYGDGNCMDEIKKYSKKINKEFGKEFVRINGYHNNVSEIICKHQVFFGKGRSILEPILNDKIGVVVSEDFKASIVNEKSYRNLYFYNFSGRSINHQSNFSEFEILFNNLMRSGVKLDEFVESSNFIEKRYNAKYLDENFKKVLEEVVLNERKTKSHFYTSVYKLIKMYKYFGVAFLAEKNIIKGWGYEKNTKYI